MSLVFIGVDNGIEGGIVALSLDATILEAFPMPLGWRRKKEIDVTRIFNWLRDMGDCHDIASVAIEEPVGSKSYRAAVSMAGGFHALRAIVLCSGNRLWRLPARKWQDDLSFPRGKGRGGQTKTLARAHAERLWPERDWRAVGGRVPHAGMIDAALIADHTRRAWKPVERRARFSE